MVHRLNRHHRHRRHRRYHHHRQRPQSERRGSKHRECEYQITITYYYAYVLYLLCAAFGNVSDVSYGPFSFFLPVALQE